MVITKNNKEKLQSITSGNSIYGVEVTENSKKLEEQKFDVIQVFNKTRDFAFNTKFNNGEPVVFAIKKAFKDIAILLAVVLVIWSVLIGVQFGKAYITNDSFLNFTMSSKYKTELTLDLNKEGSNANTVLNLLKENIVEIDENVEFVYVKTLKEQVKQAFPEKDITLKTNMKNSMMYDCIYASMKQNMPVIVCLSDEQAGYLQYAIIKTIAPHSNRVEVYYIDGTEEVMTLESFVEKTRYSDTKDKRLDFKIGLTAEIYSINTLIFMDDYQEVIENENSTTSSENN